MPYQYKRERPLNGDEVNKLTNGRINQMLFENRRISEITIQELQSLIDTVREDQWVDFKQEYNLSTPESKREILKDVTAMANADGGHIFIGVREENRIAVDFFNIDEADKVAQSINYICLHYIDPRTQGLEVDPYPLTWQNKQITIVIIHIPPSSMRPHCFEWNDSTVFVRRYGDHTRHFPMSELEKAFSIRSYPQYLDDVHSKLDIILRTVRATRISSMTPQEDALELREYGDLLRLMELRFQDTVLDTAYYRIIAIPTIIEPNKVSTDNQRIREIIKDPTNVRTGAFGFKGVTDIVPFSEGCLGESVGEQEIILLRNGFLEVRCPLLNSHFQWWKEEAGFADSNWLYPYAVCEYPVTFMRLVKELYSEIGINSDIIIKQEYWNLKGFILIPGHPSHPFFRHWEKHEYSKPHAKGRKHLIKSEFIPDQIAYKLVRELYSYFGVDEQLIPLFDENHNFAP